MPDSEVYDKAALKDLFGKIPFLNGVLGDIPASQTARVRGLIAEKRKWVEALTDRNWRSAYNRWLDHAEYCCTKADQARDERPQKRAEYATYRAKDDALKQAVQDLLKSNPPH